jgi:hypothetical protein
VLLRSPGMCFTSVRTSSELHYLKLRRLGFAALRTSLRYPRMAGFCQASWPISFTGLDRAGSVDLVASSLRGLVALPLATAPTVSVHIITGERKCSGCCFQQMLTVPPQYREGSQDYFLDPRLRIGILLWTEG